MSPQDCNQVFALLSDYIDGELPADLCRELRRHIEECPPCVEFLASLEKTRDLCRQLQAAEQPGPLAEPARQELFEAFRRLQRPG